MKKFVKLDFKIKEVDTKTNTAKFEINPLVQGFATTLGNALRRTLLSSILGTAVYAFKIKGVLQEFQNLPKCQENVVKIGLNVRKIILHADENVFPEDEKIILTLNGKGKKTLYARDLLVPSGITVVNPDQEIVTITDDDYELNMTLFAIQGRGFANFEDNKILIKDASHSGDRDAITVNAHFSPILKVGVEVEEIKIGERDVLMNLILTITTNGALKPSICLAKAAQILIAHLNHFVNLESKKMTDFVFRDHEPDESPAEKILLNDLDFSERTNNALNSQNIKTLAKLQLMTKEQLLEIKNFGQKSLKEVVDTLWDKYKIKLRDR